MLGNPTTGPRIVPFGAARLASDRLPNGHPGFRVTQRFSDLDAFFHDRIHGALDIANFYCGDVMRAMIAGRAEHLRDPNGALGVRITSADRLHQVEIWHLAEITVAAGATVAKGAQVGLCGSTGLDIAGCHAHIRYLRSGVPADPWLYLDQNITVKARFNSTTGPVNIRTGPGAVGGPLAPIYATLRNGRITRADGQDLGAVASSYTAKNSVRGATHGLGSSTQQDRWALLYIGGGYRAVCKPLVTYL